MSKSVYIPPFDTAEPEGGRLWFGPEAEGPEVEGSKVEDPEVEGHEVELTVAVELGARVGAAISERRRFFITSTLSLSRKPRCLNLTSRNVLAARQ